MTRSALLKVIEMPKAASSSLAFPWKLDAIAGEGESAVVWRGRAVASGELVAIKVAKRADVVLREAELVARIRRRWGPSILAVGRMPSGVEGGAPGAVYVASEWARGKALDVDAIRDRERVAAIVAHSVGRALAELHDAGVRHGDVKPANIVIDEAGLDEAALGERGIEARGRRRDTAGDRGATLIDLGLARILGDDGNIGGTPRYLAPEVSSRGEAGPEADLFALGLVLGEILDRDVARAASPMDAIAAWGRAESEPARWAEALISTAPGGRPRASWIAERAARWLDLADDADENAEAREAIVRRAYLNVRRGDLRGGAIVAPEVDGIAREWLEEALAWTGRIDPSRASDGATIAPLGPVHRSRWLVQIVGPAAAAWTFGESTFDEGELAARLVALARTVPLAAWTKDDVLGRARARAATWETGTGEERTARLVRELARATPDAAAVAIAEDDAAKGAATATLTIELGRALSRAGDIGRAWVALRGAAGEEADALRADLARRRGDRAFAHAAATRAANAKDDRARSSARATLSRLAWDAGDLDLAERALEGEQGASIAEMRGLIDYRRGTLDAGIAAIADALTIANEPEACARLEATRGLLEHARGNAASSLEAFGRAAELASRAGSVVEEATYVTGVAAAATDAGAIDRALASATRAALLWERLGRRADAARAWLSRAGALATIGATHSADEAAGEAIRRATEAGDERAAAFARWAIVETRAPGDDIARREAIAADSALSANEGEDAARAAARLLVWAPDTIDDVRVERIDRTIATMSAPSRWEWWGSRAFAFLAGRRSGGDDRVLGALGSLVDVAAPLASRGPALEAAVRLATERADGDAARRFEQARRLAARTLHDGTPIAWRASLAQVTWARAAAAEATDVSLAPAQIAQLESIVRALATRDRLRPLLEQVLDAMVLWTGVERGLLLLRAPDGRLVPRAARNLARRDLVGEQLALSQGIARRAIETGDAVVATDAYSTLGDMHASVHALRLRSVLAVPLIARGETLGVVYLDDRARKGAFGPRELAWVRLVASQAAMAIADARDQVLLKRAVRRAERAGTQLASILATREAELDATRTELRVTRGDGGTRYPYDSITGRSEPMRAMLKLVDKVTSSDVPVLVVGESGTGKELIARAIHANGPRASRAFVSENCASLPETLLETTLFGHVRGAFTGASATRAGLFDVADGGTLFLDEIGEMSLAMQAKLLRVLQDGEVRAVGSERTRKVDVRVIGATHRDLDAMVAAGTFREDLFYRLNVIAIRLPPLRERADDIPLLVAHFLAKHAPDGKRALKVSRPAMDRLAAFPWPGNVRQLENEMRRAIVLAEDRIDIPELSAEVARGGPSAARGAGLGMRARVDILEADLVRDALAKTNGNQTRAAELLGLSRFGLQKMMKRLQVRSRPER